MKKNDRLIDSGKFPKVVLIDTISFCNLRCSMCVHKNMKRKKGIMDWNLFVKIIDEIARVDKNTRVWMVFFGEALILKNKKPSIFDMIEYAKKKGLADVVMNSNANLLDRQAAIDLIDSGLDAIYIGIDAFKPGTYSQIRIGGVYEKVVKNVINLINLRDKMKSDKPEVIVQFVEMTSNMDEKENFIKFWTQHKAVVKIRPKVSWAGNIEASNLVLDNKSRWPCHWAMQTMSVTDKGKAVMCAVDLDALFIAGDIKIHSIEDIWNGTLKHLRQLHISGRYEELPENCRTCRDWQSAKADFYSEKK